MEQRRLEITIISAKGLKNLKHLSKMDVYVIANISGDPATEQKTPIDKDGGSSPKWNHSMKFTIKETLAQTNPLVITFKLKCNRTIRGDKEIGEVHVPVKELLDKASDSNSTKYVTYPVRKPSGKPKGELNFMFQFGDKISASSIATAYPVQAAPSNSMYLPSETAAAPAYPPVGYKPPVQGVGYSYPSQNGYQPPLPPPPAGYPPLGPGPSGYGYPSVVQPEKKSEFGGMGMGAAFVGGVLGGLFVGDLVSAAADYEAGYDPGDFSR